ncbi:MAG: hypothetical protein PHW87_11730 [Methanothrix sp.]|nr:hypothetical protein [Methanothrix sp.]
MGGSKAYDQSGTDWMGTPVSSGNQVSTVVPVVPDYLSTFSTGSADPDPFGTGLSAFSLQLMPADPASEGLVVGGCEKLASQLYLQSGKNLITEGAVSLDEQYVLCQQ